ncbi:MAG TPA: MFS transporter [Acetobacteraceae bacterium]|nr:MFS transporter [Acetobacteraceae bacterium]
MRQSASDAPQSASHIRGIPSTVWALGFVSLFMDVSSELIHALLPLFLVDRLGTTLLTVGLIEGVAEATAAITKVFSGAVSDWLGRRKLLALFGYGLSALSRPLFPLADSAGMVLAARFIDRLGKGIRGAPRDALVADVTPPEQRGAAYGLRQALDSVGAFLGPLLAVLLMTAYADHIRAVLWWAMIPAWISVLLIVFAVREPGTCGTQRKGVPIRRPDVAALPRGYWIAVLIGVLFTLARFSEGFLILKGQHAGLTITLVPLVLVGMNFVYAAASLPVGKLSDRLGRRGLLALGMLVLAGADFVLAAVPGLIGLFSGVALWGLHMALSQGLLAALVADTAPPALRGTAFGVFNLATGVVLLLASLLAGALWQAIGPDATFAAGAGFALAAAIGLLLMLSRRES